MAHRRIFSWLTGFAGLLLLLTGTPGAALGSPPAPGIHHQTVRAGHLRVQVLSPTLLRIEYAADDGFEDRPTFNAVDRSPGRTWFSAGTRGGELVVRTSAVTLRYKLGSGAVTSDNTTLQVGRTMARPAFGSPARTDALGGWYRGLDYYAGQAGPVDQLTLHPGMLNRSGWYLLDDTTTAVRTGDGWVAARPAHTGAYQDGYLFGYGHDYQRGLRDLRTLTGPSLLPPKWAFGTWFSKYQAYSAEDYETRLLPAFRDHDVPLDSLVMDTDWKAPNQWAGWNWNATLFPEPEKFLAGLNRQGINPTLNVHAAISGDDPRFPAAQAAAKGKLTPATSSFAPNPYRFDWTDHDQAAAYEQLHQPFEQQGVRQWWLDYCCDDSFVSTPGVTADSWVNELYRRDGEARGLRGFSLARIGASFPDYTTTGPSGPWAEHRSTVHFTGDTRPDWATLAFAARMTPAEGSIGESYVSHDIGSFAGTHLPDDLYLRWVQLGAFQPILRLHSDHGDRLPWEYAGTVGKPAADFLRLRESLVPYLYTAARQSYDTGLPMARALYLMWPDVDEAYHHETQYMLGDSMLIAPVITPGLSTTTPVWFPPGTWTDFFTGTTFRGPATRTVAATPDHMPVYVRAGGIIARADAAPNVARQARDRLDLDVYPLASGSTSVYDDAGDGLGYRTGRYTRTPVRYEDGRLTVGPATGGYPGAPVTRRGTVRVNGVSRPHVVRVAGRSVPFSYDPGKHVLTVELPATRADQRVTVTHDGTPLTVAQQPAVDLTLTAPDGLQSGVTSRLVATARNDGPGTITNLAATVTAPAGWTVTPRTPATAASLPAGGTFTVTYDVTPVGASPRTAAVTGFLAYRNPDGSTATLPASLTVPVRPVDVTFRVLAPPGTPPDATLYLPGNIAELGPWDPHKLAMTNRGNGIWEATITVPDGTDIQYKYTRGTWETVEEWGTITGTNNRSVTVDGGVTRTMLVDDTAPAWDEPGVPDTHLAVRYWRDPLVVSAAATASAVTLTFQRDIDFTGNPVTVTGPAGAVPGTVTEPAPGTLVWTPGSPLMAGAYTVTLSNVSSTGAAGVPLQSPFSTTFTIG
ncbi:TIM-barrel domain-containing protein [Actinoplanes sp. N902-109]|uniref:TIM-barrel domain-containing protein n=1 Tax=Actinoplanes sp. (strain N902-109) TaxID=649831 RepID=UPI00032964DB|nr:TIM-barrel domain-containing protein [Actinoplanes sp. N902-109]AGL17154.1 glycoside hydrolase family 31 [Actinoplanes sp. N902-109]